MPTETTMTTESNDHANNENAQDQHDQHDRLCHHHTPPDVSDDVDRRVVIEQFRKLREDHAKIAAEFNDLFEEYMASIRAGNTVKICGGIYGDTNGDVGRAERSRDSEFLQAVIAQTAQIVVQYVEAQARNDERAREHELRMQEQQHNLILQLVTALKEKA